MGKKVTQKEIEEKIRKSSGTMSPEADGRVLAAAGEYYRKNPAAMPNPVIAEAANTEDKNNAAVKAANNRTDKKRKRGFGSGSGQRLLVIASAVAACAILAVGILLGVKGLSKKQTVPGTDVSPTIPAEATPALPQKGQWKAGDVTYLSGIAETVFEDPNLVFYEGVNTNNATWTEVLPGYQVYTFPDGITRESAEMYCRKMEQRGFAVYENPQGSTYDYILSGHTSEKEDAREWIVLITVGTPGYVSYFSSLGWPREGLMPTRAAGILQDVNRRFMQYPQDSSSSPGRPLDSDLPHDVTPDGMYASVGAQVFLTLVNGQNGIEKAFFVLWEGAAIQVHEWQDSFRVAWFDLTGDLEPEMITIGPGIYSGRRSYYLYVYSVVDGRAREVARTLYSDYGSDWFLSTGEDGTLHVVSRSGDSTPFDARVELTETENGKKVTLWGENGMLPETFAP